MRHKIAQKIWNCLFIFGAFCLALFSLTDETPCQDTSPLGELECVYLERANSEARWQIGLTSSELSIQNGVLYIYGGIKMNAKQAHRELGYNRLHALLIEDLQPIHTARLSNSTQAKDWKTGALSELPVAQSLGKGIHMFDLHRMQPVFSKHSTKQMGLEARALERGVAVQRIESGKAKKVRDLSCTTNRFYLRTVPQDPARITFLDINNTDDGLQGSELVVNEFDLTAQKMNQTHRVVVNKSLPNYLIPRKDCVSNWRVEFPVLINNKIYLYRDGKHQQLDSINLETGERAIAEGWPAMGPGSAGRMNGSKFFTVQNALSQVKIQDPRDWRDSSIIEFDLQAEESKQLASPPEGYEFTNNFCFDKLGHLYILMLPRPREGELTNVRQLPNSILRIDIESGDSRIVAQSRSGYLAFPRHGNMAVDESHIYFVGAMPQNMWSVQRGERTGNYAIYRVAIPETDFE